VTVVGVLELCWQNVAAALIQPPVVELVDVFLSLDEASGNSGAVHCVSPRCLGTSWGPHVPRTTARRQCSRTLCTVHNVHDV